MCQCELHKASTSLNEMVLPPETQYTFGVWATGRNPSMFCLLLPRPTPSRHAALTPDMGSGGICAIKSGQETRDFLSLESLTAAINKLMEGYRVFRKSEVMMLRAERSGEPETSGLKQCLLPYKRDRRY